MTKEKTEAKALDLDKWRIFLIVLRQALLVVVTWIEKECDLKRRDK